MRTMADLNQGKRAVVKEIAGDGVLVARLSGLGLLPGVEICLLKRAPLGDPLVVEFEGQALSLRAREAQQIILEEES